MPSIGDKGVIRLSRGKNTLKIWLRIGLFGLGVRMWIRMLIHYITTPWSLFWVLDPNSGFLWCGHQTTAVTSSNTGLYPPTPTVEPWIGFSVLCFSLRALRAFRERRKQMTAVGSTPLYAFICLLSICFLSLSFCMHMSYTLKKQNHSIREVFNKPNDNFYCIWENVKSKMT